jgi:hypothetical protein
MKRRLLTVGLMVVLGGAALLVPGDITWGDDGFYVVAGSQWKRNGTNIYYTAGNVGIGTDSPAYPLDIKSTGWGPMVNAAGSGANAFSAYSTATTGPGWGVCGVSLSTDSYNAHGVYGAATGQGNGVKGINDSSGGYGVYGVNSAHGGWAICGESSATSGNGCGVYGTTSSTEVSGAGVWGFALSAVGVRGITRDGYGVVGASTGGGYGVYSIGNFAATGTKLAVVPTSQGNRKLYCQESPEVWFEDFGEGQLMGGLAHINLDPLFLETVTIDDLHPMKVFIQPNEDCSGVYVQRQATGFEVIELNGGKSSAHFTYRVLAKRKGYESARLEAGGNLPKPTALEAVKK